MLGGAAVAVGLPPLEAFMNVNGTAYAESSFPIRYGSFFWGNGVQSPFWVPAEEGENWTPTMQLQPLEVWPARASKVHLGARQTSRQKNRPHHIDAFEEW